METADCMKKGRKAKKGKKAALTPALSPPRGEGAGGAAFVRADPPKGVPMSELAPEQKRIFTFPSAFGRHVLKLPLTPKQCEILDAHRPTDSNCTTVCCNEAGKTTMMITTLVLWHTCLFPRVGNSGAIHTSGSWNQITDQLVPALKMHSLKFPKWRFLDREIQRDGIPNWMAYSVRDEKLGEGFHGSPEHPLLATVDEAKSVRDPVFRTIEERCRPQRYGLFSSTAFSTGKFYESHTSEAAFFKVFKMTVEDCPWISRDKMQRLIEKAGGGDYDKGLQDPWIRSAFFAEFMQFVQDSLLSLTDYEECLADAPPARPGPRHVRLDFAAGGDENAIGVAHGNRVWLDDAWRDTNTMSAVGRFLTRLNKLKETIGLRPEEVEGDADGLGGPMVQRIQEAGWDIVPFHAGASAFEPSKFFNRASEEWYRGCEKIKLRQVSLPDDPDTKAQLVDRRQLFHSSGLIKIESKKELFARQSKDGRPQRSPDRAEVLLGAMAPAARSGSLSLGTGQGAKGPWDDDPDIGPSRRDDELRVPEEVLAGLDAGG